LSDGGQPLRGSVEWRCGALGVDSLVLVVVYGVACFLWGVRIGKRLGRHA
jgi:hypothetical protein